MFLKQLKTDLILIFAYVPCYCHSLVCPVIFIFIPGFTMSFNVFYYVLHNIIETSSKSYMAQNCLRSSNALESKKGRSKTSRNHNPVSAHQGGMTILVGMPI